MMLTRISLLVFLMVSLAQAEWGTVTVDTLSSTIRGHTGREMLAADGSGLLHAIWMQARTDTNAQMILHRAQRGDGSWMEADTVNPLEHFVQGDPALAVSPVTGIPFVAYGTSEGLQLAMDEPALGWIVQPLGQQADFYCCPSLEIDRNGIPQIAWINYWPDSDEYHIAYYYVVWSYDIQHLMNTNLGPFGGGAFPKLTTDENYRAHIAFRGGDFGNYDIHYIHNNVAGGDQWSSDVLSTPNQDDYTCDLTYVSGAGLYAPISGNDGFGFPGRVYLKRTDENGDWTQAELVTEEESAVDAVITIPADHSAQIISSQTSGNILTGNLIASFWDDDGWVVEDISDATYYPAVTLDAQGFGHILCTAENDAGDARILHLKSEFPLGGDVISLSFEPSELQFPDTPVGDSSVIEFAIVNDGTVSLMINAGDNNPPFTCPWSVSMLLEPGAWVNLPGIFSPESAGDFIDTLWVLATGNLYATPLPCTGRATVAADEQPTLPKQFALSAYPNPFNPVTEISIELPNASHLTVTVFNNLGETMTTLADAAFPAGAHRIQFDGQDLSSGIYFIRATAGTRTQTIKAVLLK